MPSLGAFLQSQGTLTHRDTHAFYSTDPKVDSEATHDPRLPSRTCMQGGDQPAKADIATRDIDWSVIYAWMPDAPASSTLQAV